MARDLPPLMSVRAFEAAARHSSFAKAGDELCVSAGAIGHQVKLLESWLGLALFVRRPRSVELTETGRQYLSDINPLLEQMERVSLELRRLRDDAEVTVTAMPSFVTRWLMPRLGRFREAHPDVEVRVLASVPPVDFARDRVDLAIRLGLGPYPGLQAETLLRETFYPLASPGFLARHPGPHTAASLARLTLLHDEHEVRIPEQVDWPRWLHAHGLAADAARPSPGLRFSHTYLTLEAAIAGQGVALASDVLAADAIRSGALATVAPGASKGPYAYHLLSGGRGASLPQARVLAEWLKREAAAFARSRHVQRATSHTPRNT